MINTKQHLHALMEHLHIEGSLRYMQRYSLFSMLHDGRILGIEEIIEVFMDDFSVYGKTFVDCLANLDKVLTGCAEVDLVLNWENATSWLSKA
jgi:hypothetical protein